MIREKTQSREDSREQKMKERGNVKKRGNDWGWRGRGREDHHNLGHGVLSHSVAPKPPWQPVPAPVRRG